MISGQPAAGSAVDILVLTKYSRLGASSRIRFEKFIEAFGSSQQSDLSFTISPLLGDKYLDLLYSCGKRDAWYLGKQYVRRAITLLSAGRYDGVWIEKEIFPGMPAFAERLMRLMGIKMVVDFDDATFLYYEKNSNPLVRMLMRDKINHVFRAATTVTAGNEFLAAHAMRRGAANVVVLPTVVDTASYTHLPARRPRRGQVNDRLDRNPLECALPASLSRCIGPCAARARRALHDDRRP